MNIVKFSKNIDQIIETIENKKLSGRVGLKVHFGESGNQTFINPEIVEKVYKKIKNFGFDASLIECNVLYKGSRTNRVDHIKTAKKHGFDFAPIDILDGENGEEFIELETGGKATNLAKIGKGIENYDSMIVLSHFKGHQATGFGGAFKNLGMGLGSRAGKLHMHSDIKPSIDSSKCTSCGICKNNCDVDAIEIKERAEINQKICIGCAMCIATCPHNAVKIPWGGSTNSKLQEKIVDYSKAIINYLENNLIYINVLESITEHCDCFGSKMTPISDDIGILISDNPVSIDLASLDLVNKNTNNKFDAINSTNNLHILKYAKEIGLGELDYKLENI